LVDLVTIQVHVGSDLTAHALTAPKWHMTLPLTSIPGNVLWVLNSGLNNKVEYRFVKSEAVSGITGGNACGES
jgi:hypothetical protein